SESWLRPGGGAPKAAGLVGAAPSPRWCPQDTDRNTHPKGSGEQSMAVKQSEQYQLVIRSLSDRLVEAQAPIRVLDAIKWDDAVREQFLRDGCSKLPDVGVEYYRGRPLAFDPAE